ncbi:Rhodanese- sulfurtransferase [Nowakowskiella sp. JEL0407]|nr:Rhodanese- sulfurtransferase [Nowakowskiella sp. JEL0407]
MTRWERFAKAKGIQKKRKTRAKFDEDTGEWRSTYGSGSKKNDDLSDWILEVPKNADPYEDQYEKKQLEKAEKLSKNKKQQARNEAESAGTIPSRKSNPAVLKAQKKKEVEKQLVVSKSSTASLGKFDKKLKDEKKILTGKRRKFASLTGDSQEKKRAVNIAKKINGE